MSIVTVTDRREISEGIYTLKLRAPMEAGRAEPGQFVNLYTDSGAMLLPRPFGISDVVGSEIHVVFAVVGAGTRALSHLAPDDSVRMEGPMGRGLDTALLAASYDEIYLAGGGLGIAPLIYIAKRFAAEPVGVTAALGYRDSAWLRDAFEGYVSQLICISEHDEHVHPQCKTGNVIDALDEVITGSSDAAKLVIACGPVAMLKATAAFAAAQGADSLLSLEARMGCGYGACVGCTISLRAGDGSMSSDLLDSKSSNGLCEASSDMIDNAEYTDASDMSINMVDSVGGGEEDMSVAFVRKKVCKDGPFFDGSRIIWESLE